MSQIRPVVRSDLDQVVTLVRAAFAPVGGRDGGWDRDSRFLARALLEDPWTPETPCALVAVDDADKVIGSVGAQRRELLFEGEKRDAVVVSFLAVAPEHRGGAAGALLIRRLLTGQQDLAFSDSSTPEVARIWRVFGGYADATRCCEYMLVTRANRWLRGIAGEIIRRHPISRRVVPVEALPLQAVGSRLLSRVRPEAISMAPSGLSSSSASPAELAEVERSLDRRVRLRVAHDAEFLEAQFSHLEAMDIGGDLVRHVVHRAGRPIGWFAYIARPQVSRVLAVCSGPEDADAVFEALLRDATERGTAVVSGRSAPHLVEPLRRRMAVLRYEPPPLIHARDHQLRAALASSGSLLEEIELLDCRFW